MFKFFEAIAGFISTIVNFVVNLFEMLVLVITNIARSIAWLIACISYLPHWLVAFVVVPISLAVVFQIINKGS